MQAVMQQIFSPSLFLFVVIVETRNQSTSKKKIIINSHTLPLRTTHCIHWIWIVNKMAKNVKNFREFLYSYSYFTPNPV